MKNSRKYFPTYTLLAVNIAIYIYTSILGNNFIITRYEVVSAYGQLNSAVLDGEVWRLFTAIFIHADIAHIGGNMLFLFIFGLRAEDLFDLKEYVIVYFASGLAGGLLTLLLWPNSLSVGASGAIFGMLGACAIYVKRAIGQSIITALLYSFFLFTMSFGANVNFLAHLGGLLTGLLIGYLLGTIRKPNQIVTYHYDYSYAR